MNSQIRTIVEVAEEDFSHGAEVEVRGDEAKHLRKSLRVKVGEQLEVYNLCCQRFASGTVESIEHNSIRLRLENIIPARVVDPKLVVFIGVPEPAVAEKVVSKAIELGVSKLIFFKGNSSQGSFVKSIEKKSDRLEAIARSAFKQSKQVRLPPIYVTESLESAVASHLHKGGYKIFLSTRKTKDMPNLLQILSGEPQIEASFFNNNSDLPAQYSLPKNQVEINSQDAENYLVVGPEGGMSESEESFAQSRHFKSVTLGAGVLRVETAFTLASGIILMGLRS